MLNWAKRQKLITVVPTFPKLSRARTRQLMRGRPINTEEFERMLMVTPSVVGAATAPGWEFLLQGLWWSGLRLTESLDLHWSDQNRLCVDFTSRHPMFRIPAEKEKGNKDRLLPMAPEFAEMLEQVPPEHRNGFVFDPRPRRRVQVGRLQSHFVGLRIRAIAKKANVATEQLDGGKVRYCSAHDLRRSFGERWSYRVVPRVLKELMRHESIATTEKFYLGQNAQKTAAILWEQHRSGSSSPKVVSATLGDTLPANL